jgi:iron complex outermembrane receptor protein
VLVLLDGHRLNDPVYDSAYIGTDFPVAMELIERVEVVRGPSSSLYGTSAFFAIVNVITKRAAALPSLRVSVDGGSQHTRMGTASYGRETAGGTEFLVGGSIYGSGGDAAVTVPGLGVARHMDDDDAWTLFGSARRGNWSVQAVQGRRGKRIPTGAWDTSIEDPRTRTNDARGYLEVAYDGAWRGTGIAWRGSYDAYVYDGTYVLEPLEGEEGRTAYGDNTSSHWLRSEVMLTRRVARRHFLTGGVEFREGLREHQGAGNLDTSEVSLDIDTASRAIGLYVQDEFAVSERVTLSAGIRRDEDSNSIGSTNLRFAGIVKPVRNASLKLLYGSAFRAPNAYELYYYPSPTLVPERITTTEVVWEQYVKRNTRLSASAFSYHARDLITQVASDEAVDGFIFGNIEAAKAQGIELEGQQTWRDVSVLASYTFQNVRSYPDRLRLSNSPRHLSRTRVTGPIVPRTVFIGFEALYTGDRETLGGSVAEGALLSNVTLTTRELSRATFSLTVGNLMNRGYVDPAGEEHPSDVIGQSGRTVRAKLAWRF